MPESLFFTVAPSKPSLPLRRLAHLAACSIHRYEGGSAQPCEMGGVISGAVVDAIADWFGSDEARAVVQSAIGRGGTAAAVTAALAEHFRSPDA
jgi:hypothetical protein